MCMALTRNSPSLIPLSRTASATLGVMLTKSIRAGMLNVSSTRCDFMPAFMARATSIVQRQMRLERPAEWAAGEGAVGRVHHAIAVQVGPPFHSAASHVLRDVVDV